MTLITGPSDYDPGYDTGDYFNPAPSCESCGVTIGVAGSPCCRLYLPRGYVDGEPFTVEVCAPCKSDGTRQIDAWRAEQRAAESDGAR